VQSPEHAAIGGTVSAAVAWAVAPSLPVWLGLTLSGLALSVLIDLDHFPIARWYAGDWRHLRAALADPADALVDQDGTFDDVPDFEALRLGTHLLLGAPLVVLLAVLWRPAAVVAGCALAVHVGCDLLRDYGVA
jgi:hypothetical protein